MADLTTLSTVKEYLDLTGTTSEDSVLQRLVSASTRQIENYCNRRFDIQSYDGTGTGEKHDGDGTNVLFLNNTPIVSVTELKVDDDTVDPSDYKAYPDYLTLTSGVFTKGYQNVSVKYTAGIYDPGGSPPESPPEDLEDACIQLVSYKMNKRKGEGISAQSDPVATSFLDQDIPPSIRVILDRYRKPVIGAV